MEWLNYHHLLYFWVVAKRGGITRACEELRLRQPTISAQLKALEEQMGEALFVRSRRKFELTETGRLVFSYAEQIFSLGQELQDVLKGRPLSSPTELVVGISDSVPKLISYRLLRPALKIPEKVRLVCHEDRKERLLAELATHNLDLVISDSPSDSSTQVKAYNHLLGECGISFFADKKLAERCRRGFPQSLDGAPMLLPVPSAALRGHLEMWFDKVEVRPVIVGEFEDSALQKSFGQAGAGIFAAPSAIEREIKSQYEVEVVGRAPDVVERFYVISPARHIRHPAALAIIDSAKKQLFHS